MSDPFTCAVKSYPELSPKASWTTSIELRTGATSQLTTTWFARVYGQWVCRSTVSCLRPVRVILCVLVKWVLLTSGQGQEAGHEWIFYDVGGSRSHVRPNCRYLITANISPAWLMAPIFYGCTSDHLPCSNIRVR